MARITLLSECATEASPEGSIGPGEHRMWYVMVGRAFYYVSWISRSPEVGMPECMAFVCDERGGVKDWDELACSYAPEPDVALSEILDQLARAS